MKLLPGEAVALIIRRNEAPPHDYLFTIRKAESSFDKGSHEFHFDGVQEVALSIEKGLEFEPSMERAIAAIRKVQP